MRELTDSEKSRRDKIIKIQELLKEGYSGNEIVSMLSTSFRFLRKCKHGNPNELCKDRDYATPVKNRLDAYSEYIIAQYESGVKVSNIYRNVVSMGCDIGHTCFYAYCDGLFNKDKTITLRKNILNVEMKRQRQIKRYIRRSSVFSYLWGNSKTLSADDVDYIISKYPAVMEIRACIREFRKAFDDKSIIGLMLFIERYKNSRFPKIKSFAAGLENDLEAVINAVSLPYSNGFVEGNNSRLKMIKHTMFGRASLRLLEAKIVR